MLAKATRFVSKSGGSVLAAEAPNVWEASSCRVARYLYLLHRLESSASIWIPHMNKILRWHW